MGTHAEAMVESASYFLQPHMQEMPGREAVPAPCSSIGPAQPGSDGSASALVGPSTGESDHASTVPAKTCKFDAEEGGRLPMVSQEHSRQFKVIHNCSCRLPLRLQKNSKLP